MLRSNAAASSLANNARPNLDVYNSRLGLASATARSRAGAFSLNSNVSGGAGATDPFATQLTQAIEGYLNSSGQSNSLKTPLRIQITPQSTAAGSTPGTRQFIVTVSQPSATASSAAVGTSPLGSLASAAQAAPAAGTADLSAPAPAPTSEVDAYWATQPPAVRVLRTLNTEAERGAKAQELAAQGYSIDVPIMVWGYDPLATMITRKSEGYTWTPSLGQPDPQTPPGISFAGLQSYDPTKPPAGSIKVSTDFGIGLEKTSPWASAFGDMVLS